MKSYRTASMAEARPLLRGWWGPVCFFVGLALACAAVGSMPPAAPTMVGVRLDTLVVGSNVYRQVEVRSVSARSLVFLHAEGMASVLLRDLDPELQQRFGYSSEAERAAEQKQAEERLAVEARVAQRRLERTRSHDAAIANQFESLIQRFGTAPELGAGVDLRPRFLELSLGVKDQGRRPSCSVFAIVSALEYQNAAVVGQPEKLSEEYLIWATRKITRRLTPVGVTSGNEESDGDADAGFSLDEVVNALRAYGIPLHASMPNTFGTAMGQISEPSKAVVEEARSRRRVHIYILPGRDPMTYVANIVHALNAGVPVVIGMRWPHYRTMRSGFLSEQRPIRGYAHAVTLVGYATKSGRLEDAVFLFKNSYGARWGEGGYGRVSYRYLRTNLLGGVVLEVQRADDA
jgi:hypothetical protein